MKVPSLPLLDSLHIQHRGHESRGASDHFCSRRLVRQQRHRSYFCQYYVVALLWAGIGEYVRKPSDGDLVQLRNFSVSPNAIVVHDAHPNAIAEAALHLLANATLRKSIGQAGRQAVVDYFNIDRQMQQYAVLYRDIIRRKGR